MLFDAALAGEMAQKLLQQGVYLTAFSYPVVPKGQARIRVRLPSRIAFLLHECVDDLIRCCVRSQKSGMKRLLETCSCCEQVQLSAAHTKEHLDKAISSFKEVGKELGVIA